LDKNLSFKIGIESGFKATYSQNWLFFLQKYYIDLQSNFGDALFINLM